MLLSQEGSLPKLSKNCTDGLKADLKLNMKKTKVMCNNQLTGKGNTKDSRRIHILRTNSANLAHKTEIRLRRGMGQRASSKHGIMNSNLPFSNERVYLACPDM